MRTPSVPTWTSKRNIKTTSTPSWRNSVPIAIWSIFTGRARWSRRLTPPLRKITRSLLQAFRRGHDFRHRPRVWSGDVAEPGPRVWRRWEPLLVIEGVTSARRRIADRVAAALWLDGEDRETRLERAVARDGESARPHLRRWQEFEDGWFAVDRTRERCRILDA